MAETGPRTLADLLAVGAADDPALVFPDVTLSFADLRAAAGRWAGLLQHQGVAKGDFVGVLLPTCPEFVELAFAIASIGAVLVPINPRYRARELHHALADRAAAHVAAGRPLEALHLLDILSAAAPDHQAGRAAKRDALNLLLTRAAGQNFSEVMWLESELRALDRSE